MISLGTCLIDGTLPFIFYYIVSLNPSGPSPEKLCFEGRSPMIKKRDLSY